MTRFTFCLFVSFGLALVPNCAIWAQPSLSQFDLHPPLRGELNLSGSFGEVRTNSFHAGLDFRTGGKIGQRVFASHDGFVSRVRISGVGFGKALYIQHPNGLTTVYAHLDRFATEIENFVKEQQYKRESFEVDLYLRPQDIRIKRGQFVALSGNTGSSGGPHLHYEVRQTENQIPLNPAFANLPIHDTIPPEIYAVWLYPIDSSSSINGINARTEVNVQKRNRQFSTKDTARIQGVVGIGVKAYDFINRNSLRCGVYAIKMYVNSKLHYHFSMDEFSFAEVRYANSHIDFEMRQQNSKRAHRLFKDPNNLFRGYKTVVNNGHIEAKKGEVYNITIVVYDSYQNSSTLKLTLIGDEKKNSVEAPVYKPLNSNEHHWLFFKDNLLKNDLFTISLPKNHLYNHIYFTHGSSEAIPGTFSPIIHVHNRFTPVHRPYELSIKADSLPPLLWSNALVATINSKGEIESAGGSYNNGYVVTNVNYFGDFFITVDTIPPRIVPLNIHCGKNMSQEKSIRIMVEDDFSGIATLNGYINGNWVLFEHDPKNKLMFYEFYDKRLNKNSKHNLIIRATDNKGNTNQFECSFTW